MRRRRPHGAPSSWRPIRSRPHLALAELLRAQKKWPEAEAELERVIALNPDAEEAYLTLARYQVEQKQFDRARAVLPRLAERYPRSAQAQFLLGRLAIEAEAWDEAIDPPVRRPSSSTPITTAPGPRSATCTSRGAIPRRRSTSTGAPRARIPRTRRSSSASATS